jgi:hypothetical protein
MDKVRITSKHIRKKMAFSGLHDLQVSHSRSSRDPDWRKVTELRETIRYAGLPRVPSK